MNENDIYKTALMNVMAASYALVTCTTELIKENASADRYRTLINAFAAKVKIATAPIAQLKEE